MKGPSRRGAFGLANVLAVLALGGCGGPDRAGGPAPAATGGEPAAASRVSQPLQEKLLEGAVVVLGSLDAYDEQAAFAQVFDRLNQWSHAAIPAEAKDGAWRPDPLVATLSDESREAVDTAGLAAATFSAVDDVAALRDQRWLAGIAAAARGDAIDDVAVARNLFAWTVRSLAITSDPPMAASATNPGTRWFTLGEVLLSGRASGPQRAWVFLELLRHAGLEGVMLATTGAGGAELRAWIPALISGGEAWLFEPTYGMPIPGPDGAAVATARQAATDPAILRGMSLPDREYPVQAGDLATLAVLVPAGPVNVSRRMQLLDAQLAGAQRIALSVDAGALGTRAAAALPGEVPPQRVRLWEFPWQTARLRRGDGATAAVRRELAPFAVAIEEATVGGGRRQLRPLYSARLREFRGELDGSDGAKSCYLAARPSAATIAEVVGRVPPEQAAVARQLYERMKQDATYWLGVLMLAEGDYETAVDFLGRMTLSASAAGPWADGARVNLAAALRALGRTGEAAALLRADESPQRFGSRLLAEQIEKAAPAANDRSR